MFRTAARSDDQGSIFSKHVFASCLPFPISHTTGAHSRDIQSGLGDSRRTHKKNMRTPTEGWGQEVTGVRDPEVRDSMSVRNARSSIWMIPSVCERGVNSKCQNKKFYQRMSLEDGELWQSAIKFVFLK